MTERRNSTRVRLRLWAALGVLGVVVGVGVSPAESARRVGAGGPVANVWVNVSAGGSPSRCATPCPYDQSRAFGDLGSAYKAAQDGDLILIQAGTYAAQQVIVFDASKSPSGPAVTFSPSGGRVVLQGGVVLGDDAHDPPNWVTFDGGPSKDLQVGDHDHGGGVYAYALSDHVTLRNMHIGEGVLAVGGVITFASPHNLLIENDIIGPGCCGTSPDGTQHGSPINIRLTVRQAADGNPTNVTIRNNLLQGSVRFCSDWDTYYSAKYGSCPGPTTTDTDLTHDDVIHGYGCTNCVFTGNVIPYYDVQAFYMEEVNGGSNVSGTITNNYFGYDVEQTWHAIWFSLGPGATGTWNVSFNTLDYANGMDVDASDQQGRYGTATVNVFGNLGGRLGNDTRACHGSSLNVVYRYNMWTTSSAPWISHCDPTDGGPYPLSTIQSWITSDGHLNSATTPPNGFVTGSGICIPTDIDGDPRGTPCAAGEDEVAAAPPAQPPVNTALPALSGVAKDGQTLTTSNGSWSGTTPMTYAYQWVRCDAAWKCANVAGATGQSYALTSADVGNRLYAVVTASNGAGQASARTWASGVIMPAPPVNTGLPVLSGTAVHGQTLTTTDGTWTGTQPITLSYQWVRCDVAWVCTTIAGATSSAYTLTSADVGFRVYAKVTASNAAGQASARTWASNVVA